jgi:hypothetical protein
MQAERKRGGLPHPQADLSVPSCLRERRILPVSVKIGKFIIRVLTEAQRHSENDRDGSKNGGWLIESF